LRNLHIEVIHEAAPVSLGPLGPETDLKFVIDATFQQIIHKFRQFRPRRLNFQQLNFVCAENARQVFPIVALLVSCPRNQ
jgi:hypothetical protein